MKKLVAITAVTAGLLAPMATATAQTRTEPTAATPIAAAPQAAPVGSWSEDIFCAVIRFLKGGWAGRPTDCSF
ncbi:hypothetical protein [Nocardia concava]|uniref:hypothetical protein n=1 Tax=Nocardia concava TaxID=257281 RepID=UPI00031A4F2C|nr:hypothetical protein [Nocardia concava]